MGDATSKMPITKDGRPSLTAVVTCFNEENTIEEFFHRLKAALGSEGRVYEIVIVNDGSRDNTWGKIKDLFACEDCVRVVLDFFKNAGQLAALTAGIAEARGSAVLLMDSDLQLDPEELPGLMAAYDEGNDFVTGYRSDRRDPAIRTVPSLLANFIMRKASQSNLRDFGCTIKVINGTLLRAFPYGPDHVFNVPELVRRVERVAEVPVTHHPRPLGKSGWTFAKLWRYNMDNVMIALERPFQYVAALSALGSLLLVIRVLYAIVADVKILDKVTNGLLLNALAFVLLVLTALLAVIGEFTVRNFMKLQRAPAYIIRERLEKQ